MSLRGPSEFLLRTCLLLVLTISFAKNDVDAAKNSHDVGNFVAFAHLAKRREIDETWSADVVAEWVATTRRYAVEAEFALRIFDVTVAFACGNLDRVAGWAAKDRLAARLFQAGEQLLEDTQALAHLVHADQVAVIDIAVIADGYVEFQFGGDAVRLRAADVIGDTASPQEWSGGAVGNRHFGWQQADTLTAADDDLAGGEELVKLINHVGQALGDKRFEVVHRIHVAEPVIEQVLNTFNTLRNVFEHAAETHIVAHHATARRGLEEVEDIFAGFNCIQRGCKERAQVIQQEADGPQVVHDPGQF